MIDGDQLSGATATAAYEITDAGLVRKPVAYVSGGNVLIGAKIKTDCKEKVFIRAEGPDGFEVPWRPALENDGFIRYPVSTAHIFPTKTVAYYADFTLNWYISSDPESGQELSIGQSTNPLYILFKEPLTQGQDKWFEYSLIDIACRSSHGQNDEDELIESIYADFTDQCVTRVNSDVCMAYWGPGQPPRGGNDGGACFDYPALLAYDDSSCGSWSLLFKACLGVQGINSKQVGVYTKHLFDSASPQQGPGIVIIAADDEAYVNEEHVEIYENRLDLLLNALGNNSGAIIIIQESTPFEVSVPGNEDVTVRFSDLHFLVNDWNVTMLPGHQLMLTEVEYDIESNMLYDNIASPAAFIPPTNIDLVNNQVIPYLGMNGVEGQGNENPLAEFADHAIVSCQDHFYDPSYGTSRVATQTEYEQQSFAGYARYIQVQIPAGYTTNNTAVEKRLAYFYQTETTDLQTIFID